MRNQPETLHEYNIPRLNWWFLASGLLLLGCCVLLVWTDYSGGSISWLKLRGDRQWKEYQRAFYTLEQQRLADDAQAADVRAHEAGLDKLTAELQALEPQLAAKRAVLETRQREVADLQVGADRVTREFTMAKATRDEYRSFYEAALERHELDQTAPEVALWIDRATRQNELVAGLELQQQQATAALAAGRAELEAIVGERDDLERRIKRASDSANQLEKRLRQLQSPLVQTVVNAPVLEFASPTYKVEQIVAENHHVDVNFTTVPRVDRCITCHKGIDRKAPTTDEVAWREKHKIGYVDWAKAPAPLTSHPRLDLYVGDSSPHPMSKYGCTTCHWGWDRETDFSRAGHTPDEEDKRPHVYDVQAGRWVAAPAEDEELEGERPRAPRAKSVSFRSRGAGEGAESDETLRGHGQQSESSPPAPDTRLRSLDQLGMTAQARGAARPPTPPQSVALTQRQAWEKNYHWEEQEFLTQPMRARKYVQASCLKCHAEETKLEGAESLDHGRRLVEQLGCWSCHKIKQLESWSIHRVAEGETFEEICRTFDVNPDEVRRINGLTADNTLAVGRELTLPIRTLRQPGPSLYKVAAKTSREWTRKWLADPVAFRGNTYMPRFWGLDNNPWDEAPAAARNHVEINAIAEYLFNVSEQPALPAPPVPGDAARGQELVQQVGCLGCHVVDEKLMSLKAPRNLAKFMDQWQYRRLRSQGPQLAGTGSKTAANWAYAWLKDPKQYHPGTKMPNLRLSDQEASDIAAWLTTLHNKATDDQQLAVPDPQVLDAVTLEYLQVTLPRAEAEKKLHDLDSLIEPLFADAATQRIYQDPAELARRAAALQAVEKDYAETFDDALQKKADTLKAGLAAIKDGMAAAKKRVAALSPVEKQNVFLGNKLIARYGCFACHEIHGFETAKAIGTELSEWGSKPVNKLDFGLVELEPNRIAWLKQKLHAPRSFDTGRRGITRSPQEYLRMGKFNLTEEQIDQIVTVVTGLTDEKLTASEPRQLTPAEFHIERGRWVAKELNCAGCHQLEGQGWAIRAAGIPTGMEPPMLSGTATQLRQGQRTRPEWLFNFLKAPQTGEIRPWLKVRMPTFGLTDGEANVLVRYFALEGRSAYPYQSPAIDTSPEHLAAGKQLFTQLKCALCHIVEGKALGKPLAEIPAEDLPRLAPNLSLAHARLQRDWLVDRWLPEPLAQVPGTRMPQFEYGATIAPGVLGGDGRRQIEALVDYVLSIDTAGAAVPAVPPTKADAKPAVGPSQ